MVNYREILRLSSDPKDGQGSIALLQRYDSKGAHRSKKTGVSWPLDDTVQRNAETVSFPGKGYK